MVAVTNQGNLPQAPFNVDQAYVPDQLIAGDMKRVTDTITVPTQGAVLPRGEIMGQITVGSATAAAAGGNTGNGTCSAVTRQGSKTQVGVYKALFTAATAFDVIDPSGRKLSSGVTGGAYADDIGFTITVGGTAFVAGDAFNITVAAGSGSYIPSVATATDGSENPVAILADSCDATGGAVSAGIYLTGEFNSNAITFDSSWTVAALKPLLSAKQIYLKTTLSAADPT